MGVGTGGILRSEERVRSTRSVMPHREDGLSDEHLMDSLAGPEVEAALSALYDRYSRTVFGVGLKLLGDRSLAEELVQEVFLRCGVPREPSTLRGAVSLPGFTGSREALL